LADLYEILYPNSTIVEGWEVTPGYTHHNAVRTEDEDDSYIYVYHGEDPIYDEFTVDNIVLPEGYILSEIEETFIWCTGKCANAYPPDNPYYTVQYSKNDGESWWDIEGHFNYGTEYNMTQIFGFGILTETEINNFRLRVKLEPNTGIEDSWLRLTTISVAVPLLLQITKPTNEELMRHLRWFHDGKDKGCYLGSR